MVAGTKNGVGFRERIPGDSTVGGLRGEKEKRSTRGRLRVDFEIGSFFKLLEVGFSPYLSFTPI